jgi:ribosomal protein L29
MKKTAKTELRAKSAEDLKAQADALRADLLKARLAGTVEGKQLGVKYRAGRRQIARLETLIREKAAAAAKAK